MNKNLINKPLVEAVLGLKWTSTEGAGNEYNFFVGKFYEKIKHNFPNHVGLPSSQIPSEQLPFVPQYQFNRDHHSPIVQIGNGILTINELQSYTWNNHFEKYCNETIANFIASININNISIEEIKLSYINAIEVDFSKISPLDYLKEYFGFEISLPNILFEDGNISADPYNFHLNILLPVQNPKGALGYSFRRGRKDGKDALIWEILFISADKDVINISQNFNMWLHDAHEVIEKSFFGIIEKKLINQFNNVQQY